MQRLSQNKVLFFYSGSAAANLISEISMPGILYTYIRWKGLHKATWGGKNCLEVWRGLTCLYTDVKLGLSQVKINGYSEGWGCEQVFPVAFKSLNTQRIILWSRLFFFFWKCFWRLCWCSRTAGNTHQLQLMFSLVLINRLVQRVSGGLGLVCQAGHSRSCNDVCGVVDLWAWRIPGRWQLNH